MASSWVRCTVLYLRSKHHHGTWPEQCLQVVWQFWSPCITWIHCNVHGAGRNLSETLNTNRTTLWFWFGSWFVRYSCLSDSHPVRCIHRCRTDYSNTWRLASLISVSSKTNLSTRRLMAREICWICCATTDNTSREIRLNSSKQHHDPLEASPQKKVVLETIGVPNSYALILLSLAVLCTTSRIKLTPCSLPLKNLASCK